jgi:UDP-glucose 4-epimerase
MKVTVFGGGGFIGSHVVDRLIQEGVGVRVFERPRVEPYRCFLNSESVEWINGDFFCAADIGRSLDGVDAVIHLVSNTLPKSSNEDPVYDVQTNLIATIQLLNGMLAKNVKRLVFISSAGTVYGDPIRVPVDETHPTEPFVSYGIVKLAIEKFLLMYQRLHGVEVRILRVSNPYGERQRVETAQGVVTTFLERAVTSRAIDIWGDGSVVRDFLHVRDVAEAFVRALNYRGKESVFNIGSGQGVSLNELIQVVENAVGRKVECRYKPGRPFDVAVNVLDIGLALRELGWKPTISLKEGVKATLEWMQRQITAGA